MWQGTRLWLVAGRFRDVVHDALSDLRNLPLEFLLYLMLYLTADALECFVEIELSEAVVAADDGCRGDKDEACHGSIPFMSCDCFAFTSPHLRQKQSVTK